MTRSFYELIKNAKIEKDVEFAYTTGINLYFPSVDIQHPFQCDGFMDTKTVEGKRLKLILEYKIEELFSNKVVRAKVITQVLFYMKKFELNGCILPNVCLIGDKNECFVFHTNSLLPYLDRDIDWSVSPSMAASKYPNIVMDISDDESINPFVFDINEKFSFKIIVDKINDLANNIQRYVHITEHNVATIYDIFLKKVIKNNKFDSNQIVEAFLGVINS